MREVETEENLCQKEKINNNNKSIDMLVGRCNHVNPTISRTVTRKYYVDVITKKYKKKNRQIKCGGKKGEKIG